MTENTTIAKRILQFNEALRNSSFDLPEGYRAVNPYSGDQSELVEKITTAFYQKYYNDTKPRRIILGSSPARRGSAVTGVPFEDAKHLQNETGIFIDEFYINQSSSDFLYDVMTEYGSCEQFYTDFYMNFVCPLGIVRTNAKGNEVNCNYYENKKLQTALKSFILESIRRQIDFGIDTSVCYCIGSGENFHFLSKINDEHHFFGTIIPLEHPRFIMQYNSKNKDVYMKKYLCALKS
ncbi:SMUG2 DNA glycosylase family protein [Listeria monocytogenes]|uniref:SMUG2 DNA glycosylase family protein n=1 Tax=Listeria monocytogenes TaxID=1639 RepID=A0A823J2U3_LISMN|nr:SMUG2 DNA glycosylase family protein [Listeria monocytogenes]EAC7885043.1 SMUG2 DNA glycosylase family protein [Listeria monocytogenes]EAE5922281.1 SMUG2 DNA glycosylase family protein [Listeria monocytogenes]EAF0970474.1 SMUG2 DNA glycosylase family protein [Listeria monocytogenes]EAG2314150.1 SMUG2 DNA glycosylase family protein [Listeria monocytogenes]EAG4184020.1 SMUG2 DNA glycosylase family protein [Listeria monocytogenes]